MAEEKIRNYNLIDSGPGSVVAVVLVVPVLGLHTGQRKRYA